MHWQIAHVNIACFSLRPRKSRFGEMSPVESCVVANMFSSLMLNGKSCLAVKTHEEDFLLPVFLLTFCWSQNRLQTLHSCVRGCGGQSIGRLFGEVYWRVPACRCPTFLAQLLQIQHGCCSALSSHVLMLKIKLISFLQSQTWTISVFHPKFFAACSRNTYTVFSMHLRGNRSSSLQTMFHRIIPKINPFICGYNSILYSAKCSKLSCQFAVRVLGFRACVM